MGELESVNIRYPLGKYFQRLQNGWQFSRETLQYWKKSGRNILPPLYQINYLRMLKNQFFNTAFNLLAKLLTEKVNPFLFSNVLKLKL